MCFDLFENTRVFIKIGTLPSNDILQAVIGTVIQNIHYTSTSWNSYQLECCFISVLKLCL